MPSNETASPVETHACQSSHCRLNGCAFPQACPNDRPVVTTPAPSGERSPVSEAARDGA